MQKKKIKYYSVTMDDSMVFCISLVDEPAIESDFVCLKKQESMQVCLQQDEKHMVIGAVLVPDMPIYRNQGGEEFYIQFSAETIEKLAHDFVAENRSGDFSWQHEDSVKGVHCVESWVVIDPERDKSLAYGLHPKRGTWMLAAKIDDEDLWNKVKSGEAKGFSVEAFVNLDELNLKKIDKVMDKDKEVKMEAVEITSDFWDKLRSIIADALGKPQESSEVEDTVGKVADEIEVAGGPKDSETKVVEEAKKKKKTSCEDVAPDVDDKVKEVVDKVDADADSAQEAKDKLQAVIDGLNEEIKKKDAEIANLKKENAKLSKQPSAKPVKTEMEKKQSPREIIEALRNGSYFKE